MKRVAVLRTILALNVIVTAAAMALAYRALRHADDSERLVIRSHQTLQAAEETLRRVVDAETSERAYLLTGDAKDLEAFAAMMALVGAPMETLTAILREDGRGTDAERLRAHVGLTLAAYERVVEHRRASGSIDSAGRATARAEMEVVRGTIGTIRRTENDLLDARIHADASADRRVSWLAIVMTGLATTLMTTLVAALVFLARPGVWR